MLIFVCNNKVCSNSMRNNPCMVMCIVKDRIEFCAECGYDNCIIGDCRIEIMPTEIPHICEHGETYYGNV